MVGAVLAALLVLVFPGGARAATLPVALVLSAAGLLAGLLRPTGATLALAAAAPLLAGLPRAWGETAEAPLLPLVAVSLLAGVLARRRRDGEPPALPPAVARWGGGFLAVAAASAVGSAVRGESLYLLLHGGASPVFLNSLGMTAEERTRAAVVLFSVLATLWASLDAFSAVAREERGRARLAGALAAGLAATCLVVVLERFLASPLTAARWVEIGRFSGLASDPNALGVLAAVGAPLLAGFLFARPGRTGLAAAAGLVLLLPVLERSGSRTALLLIAFAAVAAGVGLVRAGGRARRVALGAGAAGVAALVLVAALAPRGGAPAEGGLLGRLGSSISAPSAVLVASHRPMFWGAAFDLIAVEPLSGVGLGGFPFEFPAAHLRRSGEVTPATDNATNLLLDVAAESGLPALLLALGAAVPLLRVAMEAAFGASLTDPLGRAAGAALAGFAAASLTGSHLRFAEVALVVSGIAALLPAASTEGDRESVARPRRVFAVLVGAGVLSSLLAAATTLRPDSAFRQERWAGVHDRGRPRRWTSAEAFRRIAPGERRVALTLANERPDGRPVLVRFRVDGLDAGRFSLRAGEPRQFAVLPGRGADVVRLSIEPTFVPARLGSGPDHRELGVRIHADPGTVP